MSTSEPRRATILAVDDEPSVLAAVARDLRRGFGEHYRILRAGSRDFLSPWEGVTTLPGDENIGLTTLRRVRVDEEMALVDTKASCAKCASVT